MPALTTIIAGVSALATVATVDQAQSSGYHAEQNQKASQDARKAELETELAERNAQAATRKESDLLSSQDKGKKVADIELGTSKASDALLKRTTRNVGAVKSSQSTKVGGLAKGKAATKVGGL